MGIFANNSGRQAAHHKGWAHSNPHSHPVPITAEAMKNVPVGGKKEIKGACSPDQASGSTGIWGVWNAGGTWPPGHEFHVYRGPQDGCRTCSDNWADEGLDCPGISKSNKNNNFTNSGRRVLVQRTKFYGTPEVCCAGEMDFETKTEEDTRTCDPKYRSSSTTDCKIHMEQFCKGKWGNKHCMDWSKRQLKRGRVSTGLKRALLEEFSAPPFQDFCKYAASLTNNDTAASVCDSALQIHCKKSSDSRCQCINPPQDLTKLKNAPSGHYTCWYAPCKTMRDRWFLTSDQRDVQRNCNSVVCTVDVGDVSLDGKGNVVLAENKCGSSDPAEEEDDADVDDADVDDADVDDADVDDADVDDADVDDADVDDADVDDDDKSQLENTTLLTIGAFAFLILCLLFSSLIAVCVIL